MKSATRAVTAALTLIATSGAASGAMIEFSGAITGFRDLGGAPRSAPVAPFLEGQPFNGRIEFEDGLLTPGGSFGNADILDYRFNAGSRSVANAHTSISGTVADNGNELSAFSAFTNIGFLGPDCSLCTASIDTGTFSIQDFAPGNGIIDGRFDSRIGAAATEVPTPGGTGLLAFVLLGLCLCARYKNSNIAPVAHQSEFIALGHFSSRSDGAAG